jgi:hypothetical protein
VYVALQLAQLLASLKGGVVTNLDPYDFDAWVKKLAGSTKNTASENAEVPNAR